MQARKEIEALTGAEEYKRFADELVRVSRTARQRHLEMELPTLVTVTGSGQGNTTCLRLLAALMKEERILPFSGEEEAFEWRMLVNDGDAVARLLVRMEQAAGFYPYFSGVIGLDLDGLEKPEQLDGQLFELIRDNQRRALFCLRISEAQEKCLPGLLERLRPYTQAIPLRLAAGKEEMCQFVRGEFRRKGFILADGTDEPILKLVEAAGKEAFRSLRTAVSGILWRKLNGSGGILIRPEDILVYHDSLKSAAPESRKQRSIGFGAHDERR